MVHLLPVLSAKNPPQHERCMVVEQLIWDMVVARAATTVSQAWKQKLENGKSEYGGGNVLSF